MAVDCFGTHRKENNVIMCKKETKEEREWEIDMWH